MRRCCPDSCNTGNFTKEDCLRFGGAGTCIYPNDAQCHILTSTDTCYITGDGTGGTEKYLGMAATREECLTMVRTREPTANGVTFPNRAGPGSCYAEFGMTGPRASQSWQTCHFEGRLIKCNLVAFIVLY